MPSPAKHSITSSSSNGARVGPENDQNENKVAEAAFYFITNSLTEKLKDKEDLVSALCIATKNPTLSQVNSLWTGSPIDLKEFCEILPKIDTLDESKLNVAFSKLSPKKQSSMPKDQLTSILTSCGEVLSANDIKQFLECVTRTNPEVIDKDGEVSYQKLVSALVTAAKDARKNSLHKFDMHNTPSPLKRMTSGNRRRRSSIALQKAVEAPSNIHHWTMSSIKGAFYFDDEKKSIISHQYQMEVPEDCSVYCTVKSRLGDLEKQPHDQGEVDTRIFILSEDNSSHKCQAFTHEKNDKNEYVCRIELKKGTYNIIPFTTGCFFSPKHETRNQSEIIKMVDNKPILQSNYIEALTKIFNIMDLDGNNLLSREEFNLFNWRTSGEEVADDEWEVVKDNFELEDGELTLNGFIDLHQMEAEDCNGEENDLWVTLYSMGFNESLHLDESCPFEIKIFTPKTKVTFEVLFGLKSGGHTLTKALTKFVIENGHSTKIKNLQDLSIHQLSLSNWSCIIVQNKSHSVVSVKVDCSESENCKSHQNDLNHSVTVGPKTAVIAHHLMPIATSKPWKVKYYDTLVQ